jgi:hypothetical protein
MDAAGNSRRCRVAISRSVLAARIPPSDVERAAPSQHGQDDAPGTVLLRQNLHNWCKPGLPDDVFTTIPRVQVMGDSCGSNPTHSY